MLKTINNSINRVSKDIEKTINWFHSEVHSNFVFDSSSSFVHTSWIDLSSDKHDQSTWIKEDNSKHQNDWICVDSFEEKKQQQS